MSWLDKLQTRWGLKSISQVIIVLIVFACTGFSVLFLKRPVVAFFTSDGETNIWFSVIYYILILPIYNIILLFYGFIFGQFSFFWAFEKRMWYRMTGKKQDAE
jgi:hypothetical protein